MVLEFLLTMSTEGKSRFPDEEIMYLKVQAKLMRCHHLAHLLVTLLRVWSAARDRFQVSTPTHCPAEYYYAHTIQ